EHSTSCCGRSPPPRVIACPTPSSPSCNHRPLVTRRISMDIGLGLPSTIPGVEPATVLRWAIDAEARGFASVGVVDRLVYPNLDPMTMLAATAVVTTRV